MPTLTRLGWYVAALVMVAGRRRGDGLRHRRRPASRVGPAHFLTADRCMPCHNGLTTRDGCATPRSASTGADRSWRTRRAIRTGRRRCAARRWIIRELTAEIQDECSTCHMPMQRFAVHAAGGRGKVFARFPSGERHATSSTASSADGGLVHDLPPDPARQLRPALELQRWLHDRHDDPARAATDLRAVRRRTRPPRS